MTFDVGAGDRSSWNSINAEFHTPPVLPGAGPWWRRHLRWVVLGLTVAIVLGSLVWRASRDQVSTPQSAVQDAARLVAQKDYAALRASLCTPDRVRYSVQDLSDAGRRLHLLTRGLEGFTPTTVTKLPNVRYGPVGVPASRVDGQLVAALGAPSAAYVTVVHEPTAWKICLSAGGYGLALLGVDEPFHADLTG